MLNTILTSLPPSIVLETKVNDFKTPKHQKKRFAGQRRSVVTAFGQRRVRKFAAVLERSRWLRRGPSRRYRDHVRGPERRQRRPDRAIVLYRRGRVSGEWACSDFQLKRFASGTCERVAVSSFRRLSNRFFFLFLTIATKTTRRGGLSGFAPKADGLAKFSSESIQNAS